MQGDCVACHRAEYDATTSPPHDGLFGVTCGDCHDETMWVPARAIRHDWFPLRNRHAMETCISCHTVGFRPGDTSSACVSCHRDDYDAAVTPPHALLPTTCETCHSDAGWRPATFVHTWPLTGAHQAIACASCHGGDPPVYVGTPTECVGCHRDDYDASPYPGHAMFPTTCADCHTTTAWTPALGGAHPETAFPITRGAHHGIRCLDCHKAELGPSTAGMNADCVGCHTGQHTRATMDAKHREVPDYPPGPAAPNFCLDCHPDGRN